MTNKILTLLLVIVTSLPITVQAQDQEMPQRIKHRVYMEVSTLVFLNASTINYEPTLFETDSRNFRINAKVGLGLGWIIGFDGDYGVTLAHTGLTMDYGKRNNHFVLTSGLLFGSSFNEIERVSEGFDQILTAPLLELGWRYEKPTGGLTYKVSASTLGLNFGIGYAF